MATPAGTFAIGMLSQRSGCSVDTIRYYERLRLIPGVTRSEGGHRLYDEKHLRRLAFIRRCRALGLSLAQIRTLLHEGDRKTLDCGTARPVLESQLVAVRRRITEFRALERDLREMVDACRGTAEPGCRADETGCRVFQSWRTDGASKSDARRSTGKPCGADAAPRR